jgi:hypothetical protein
MDVLKDGHVIAVTFSTLATARGGPGAIKISPETKRVRVQSQDLRDWR